jgi:hypothetical protein
MQSGLLVAYQAYMESLALFQFRITLFPPNAFVASSDNIYLCILNSGYLLDWQDKTPPFYLSRNQPFIKVNRIDFYPSTSRIRLRISVYLSYDQVTWTNLSQRDGKELFVRSIHTSNPLRFRKRFFFFWATIIKKRQLFCLLKKKRMLRTHHSP